MTVIITKQNDDGTYSEVGMNNRRIFSHYKTRKGAIKHGRKGWEKFRCRFEFFGNGIYKDPSLVLFTPPERS